MHVFFERFLSWSLCFSFWCVGMANAEQLVLYPVQSGIVSDGSCCSPYAYSNSADDLLLVTGCFNSTYGCHFRKDYAAWRWDMSSIPEDAKVTGAVMYLNHPSPVMASWVDIWVDATRSSLNSNYVSSMFSNHDQHLHDVSYWAASYSFFLDIDMVNAAIVEGNLAMKLGNGEGADGVVYINTGDDQPRITVFYEIATKPCPADLNGDGIVDSADLGIFLWFWGSSPSDGDFNGDGVVDSSDLGVLLGAWGECP